LFTHDQGILPGRATQWNRDTTTVVLTADEGSIGGGSSGGPAVTREGGLLGILSRSAGSPSGGHREGILSRVHLAVGAWLVRQMIPSATQKLLNAALPRARWSRPYFGKKS
jgi:S1-C subfamily serine protease